VKAGSARPPCCRFQAPPGPAISVSGNVTAPKRPKRPAAVAAAPMRPGWRIPDGRRGACGHRKRGVKVQLGRLAQRSLPNRRWAVCAVMEASRTTAPWAREVGKNSGRPESTERAGSSGARCGRPDPSSGVRVQRTRPGKGGKTVTVNHRVGAQRQRSQRLLIQQRLKTSAGSGGTQAGPDRAAGRFSLAIAWRPLSQGGLPAKVRPAADVGSVVVESASGPANVPEPASRPRFRPGSGSPRRAGEPHRERFSGKLATGTASSRPAGARRASCDTAPDRQADQQPGRRQPTI